MTDFLHKFPKKSQFDQKLQISEFEYLLKSENAKAALAENYVGL